MLYMVIETYPRGPEPVYERAAERGRMLPAGLRYIDSWVADDERSGRCFQLMATDDPELFDVWCARWADVCEFDIIPVIKSAEAPAAPGLGGTRRPLRGDARGSRSGPAATPP